jgi:anthranilate/para-aminobenzoate synthase component II
MLLVIDNYDSFTYNLVRGRRKKRGFRPSPHISDVKAK